MSLKHESDKVIAFERGNLLWVYNFHPTKSFENYKLGTNWRGTHRIVLNSDLPRFGGHNRVDMNGEFHTFDEKWNDRDFSMFVYIPCRTVLVFRHD